MSDLVENYVISREQLQRLLRINEIDKEHALPYSTPVQVMEKLKSELLKRSMEPGPFAIEVH